MKPLDYYNTLRPDQRNAYAIAAGTTLKYLRAHVFRGGGPTRTPSNRLIVGLAKASNGHVTLDEAIDYFLVRPIHQLVFEAKHKK
ncbi:hypothetical protein [Thiothrix lacustris]|uniref:hypothetical protein n=1 Tax=Thiothrix lacustris TaxID=525917 RepID=UPI0027E3B765|nr:hypothetical protein [Thiothrix lacustris]WMP17269.1 hypothetical protein RCS87_18070 [Thiothrix lacustris]